MPLRIAIDVRRIADFGIGSYIRNLVLSLAEFDTENEYLLAGGAEIPEFSGLPANFKALSYQPPKNAWLDPLSYPLYLRKLRADLIHIPLNQVPPLLPHPYVVTIHDMSNFLFGGKTTARDGLRLYFFRSGLLQANRVIAVSAATQRDAQNLLGVPEDRIRLVYSAPDPRFLQNGKPVAAGEQMRVLERYQIQRPYILYAGRIRPHKNLPRLIEAFAVVRGDLEQHPRWRDLRLLVIGDQLSSHPEVRRTVAQTRVQNAVRFLGFLPFETLKVFYSAASAFVFPSLYEGFGLPPLEAMACGVPVVSSAVSSLPEVVGEAAVIVTPENVFDIARGIKEVLLDDELRARLIQAGFERARQFQWRRTAEQTLEVYKETSQKR